MSIMRKERSQTNRPAAYLRLRQYCRTTGVYWDYSTGSFPGPVGRVV